MPVIGNYAGMKVSEALASTSDNNLGLNKSTPNGPAPIEEQDLPKDVDSNAAGSAPGTSVPDHTIVVVNIAP